MSSQTPSQDLPSNWAERAYLDAAKDGWDDLLDKADQPSILSQRHFGKWKRKKHDSNKKETQTQC